MGKQDAQNSPPGPESCLCKRQALDDHAFDPLGHSCQTNKHNKVGQWLLTVLDNVGNTRCDQGSPVLAHTLRKWLWVSIFRSPADSMTPDFILQNCEDKFLLFWWWISCDPMDFSSPGSSVHGISQAKALEWIAISFSKESSKPMDLICIFCIGRRILYH